MIYQKFAREQLPDIIKLSAVMNGLKGSVKSFMLLNLNFDSSFSDLDNLLAIYVSTHDKHEPSVQHELSVDNLKYKACRDKPKEERRKENIEGRGIEAYPPSPTPQILLGKGKSDQLPPRNVVVVSDPDPYSHDLLGKNGC